MVGAQHSQRIAAGRPGKIRRAILVGFIDDATEPSDRRFDCATCPDGTKIGRRCRYELETPSEGYPSDRPVACIAYGLNHFTLQAIRLERLVDRGAIPLDELDGRMFDGIEAASAARGWVTDLMSDDKKLELAIRQELDRMALEERTDAD